ncbi:peptidase domain-containing ABC transporter [Lacrimispora sp.]|uniref:peptidase domain-containing ABC transporter n=1 Tax=Lacrimispora sp. TaxID=2719234 RepID=UPI003995C2C1
MKIDIIMQTKQNECGLCAAAMLASYYGYRKDINFYRSLFQVGRDGMSVKNICDIFRMIKFKPLTSPCGDIKKSEIRGRIPCILYWDHHFVVIEKIKNQDCYICDPAAGRVKISLSEINGYDEKYMIYIKKTDEFAKEKDKAHIYYYIIRMLKGIEVIFLIAVIASILVNVMNIIIPQILQSMIDFLINGSINKQKKVIIINIFVVSVFYLVFTKLRNNKLVELQGVIVEKFSLHTMRHLFRVSYGFFDSRSTGDILYRLNTLFEVQKQVSGILISLIISITSISAIYVYICIIKNIFLFVMMTIVFIILYIFVFLQNTSLLERNRRLVSNNQGLNRVQTEIISQMYQIKCMNLEDHFFRIYKQVNEKFKKGYIHNQKGLSDFSMIIGLFEMFIPLMIIFIMIFGKFQKNVSIGSLFTFYIIMELYVKYVMSLANTSVQIHTLRGQLYYINDLLNEKELKKGKFQIDNFNQLTFDDVSFQYNSNQKDVLSNIRLIVKRGEKIAIVGMSGSGKSTIVKLIAKLYPCTSGKILINGEYKIEDIMEDNFADLFGIVPQQSVVFNKTIRENLTLCNNDISNDALIEALKMVNLWDEIEQMPMKLDTMISNENKNLSGGQIQKLSIARSVLRKPQILILDESTSSLDSTNELDIHSNLKKMGITLIVISHRLSTIQDANCIYVLNHGRLEEIGTHEELLSSHKLYCQLYEKQCLQSKEIVEEKMQMVT